ncbi:MAG: hypothetical protein K0R50_2030 [Eubacterium sp.]|jgi:uncharacterized protein with NRDE domain|nr:hypothetical protein [Eubacterium sp.]
MRKKVVTGVIIFALMTAGVQVFAATYLDTNIIGLISQGINSITGRFLSASNTEGDKLDEQYKQKVGEYIGEKTSQVNKEIETHTNNEIKRANQEINSYYNNVKKEADSVFNSKVKQAKEEITANVNSSVQNIKNDINKELEKQLKEKLK